MYQDLTDQKELRRTQFTLIDVIGHLRSLA